MSSTNKRNKVKFNICNVHYAPLSQDNDGKYTWATPVALPGAVSLSLDPQGEPESFYADGIEYYVINNNQGYDGDLEVALIPESFRRDILMETTDANSVLLENAASETSRPSISAKTNEESREVQTETLTVKARPLSTGYVKAKTGDSTTASVYNNWYKSVYQPADTPAVDEDASAGGQG